MLLVTKSVSSARFISVDATKQQVYSYTIKTGDTSGSFVPDSLKTISHVFAQGYLSNVDIAITGTTVAFTFSDPGATKTGSILVIGT